MSTTKSEQLQTLASDLDEALDYIESLNERWNWFNINRNDESEFKSVQAFLVKHGRHSQACEF
jgi:hypothetical protein